MEKQTGSLYHSNNSTHDPVDHKRPHAMVNSYKQHDTKFITQSTVQQKIVGMRQHNPACLLQCSLHHNFFRQCVKLLQKMHLCTKIILLN